MLPRRQYLRIRHVWGRTVRQREAESSTLSQHKNKSAHLLLLGKLIRRHAVGLSGQHVLGLPKAMYASILACMVMLQVRVYYLSMQAILVDNVDTSCLCPIELEVGGLKDPGRYFSAGTRYEWLQFAGLSWCYSR